MSLYNIVILTDDGNAIKRYDIEEANTCTAIRTALFRFEGEGNDVPGTFWLKIRRVD